MQSVDAANARQLDVHQNERRLSLLGKADAFFTGFRRDDLIALDLQRISYQFHASGLSSTMRISSFAMTHRQRERERRAHTLLTLHPDPPAVEFHKLSA